MFLSVPAIVWYNLDDHTTHRNGCEAGENEFCQFSKIEDSISMDFFEGDLSESKILEISIFKRV